VRGFLGFLRFLAGFVGCHFTKELYSIGWSILFELSVSVVCILESLDCLSKSYAEGALDITPTGKAFDERGTNSFAFFHVDH
jgi:hypothetical protein